MPPPYPARKEKGRSRFPVTADAHGLTNPGTRRSLAVRLPYEIRACCRLAGLLDIPLVEAASNIVPVAVTAGESVERLRGWAAGRCLSADRPGIYSRDLEEVAKPGRNVRRGDPSAN